MIQILLIPVLGLVALQFIFFVFIPKPTAHVPSRADLTLLKRVRWIGVAVMAIGLVTAEWVYRHTEPIGPDPRDIIGYETSTSGDPVPILATQSKKAIVQSERMGGKFGAMLDKVEPWFTDQWHGRRLATTLIVISGMIFLACFLWARILTFPERTEPAPSG